MAYQLVFRFLLPIYRTTKQMRRSFRDMQHPLNGNAAGAGSATPHAGRKSQTVGDYIDFEEVKDA